MSLLKELWGFMKARKKFWLAPIIIVLVILSALLVLAANAPWVAGFIYPII
jgi:competence protein ComGC